MLPDGWTLTTLGAQLEKIAGGGTPSRKKKSYWGEKSDLPWMTVKDLKNRIISKTKEHITHDGLKNSASNLIPANTVIVCTRMAVGKAVRCTVDVTINQDLKALYPKKSLNSEFLHNFLTANALKIERLSSGSTVKGIQLSELKSLKMHLPPLAEQELINGIISDTEKRTELLTNFISEKQNQKKALMQRLLKGKHRFPEFEGQEWQEVELGDVFERVRRKNDEHNTNVVTISGQQGFVLQSDYFKKNIASSTLDGYFLLHKGEFAYNKSYSNGYPMGAIKRLNILDKGVVTTLYICFALKDEKKSCANFFEQFFESGSMVRGLSKIANEGGRAHGLLNVTPSDFFKLKMKIPAYAEQQKIATVLNAADKEIDLLTQKLEAYQDQKKGLMQQLLTGKKRVNLTRKEAA